MALSQPGVAGCRLGQASSTHSQILHSRKWPKMLVELMFSHIPIGSPCVCIHIVHCSDL